MRLTLGQSPLRKSPRNRSKGLAGASGGVEGAGVAGLGLGSHWQPVSRAMHSSERPASENGVERASGREEVWFMTILILEALGAGALLIFIVWWTMFAGRKGGELSAPTDADQGQSGGLEESGKDATPTTTAKALKDIKPEA